MVGCHAVAAAATATAALGRDKVAGGVVGVVWCIRWSVAVVNCACAASGRWAPHCAHHLHRVWQSLAPGESTACGAEIFECCVYSIVQGDVSRQTRSKRGQLTH